MRLFRSPSAIVALAVALVVLAAVAPSLRAAAVEPLAPVVVRQVDVRATSLARAGQAATSARTIRLPIRANLIGAAWTGSATALELRARGADGRWSRWVDMSASGDGPDPGTREARALRGRRAAASPVWVGDAESVQVRTHAGRASSLRLAVINVEGTATSRARSVHALRVSAARVLGVGAANEAAATVFAPAIRSRARWSARPARATPGYAEQALGVVVHHTVSTNRYTCAQVPAMLRGIQRYHMDSNGWNDIGYNFLIDRCGVVWEGRGGGLTKPVIGAHTSGFNTSTVGVSLLGAFGSVRPSAAQRAALAKFVAWRMDVAHVSPTGKMALVARTGDKFPNGSRVVVRAVSGHRDLFPTSCPGAMSYRELGTVARTAWPLGGVKVANVTRGYRLADPATGATDTVAIRAVANQRDARMTIRIQRRSTGEELRAVSLTGPVIATTWQSQPGADVPIWDLRIRIDATSATGQRARPFDESVAAWAPAPGFEVVSPPAPRVEPGGDPADDQIRIGFTLAAPATLGVWLHDPPTGELLAELAPPTAHQPTNGAVGELVGTIPAGLPDGAYEVRVGVADDEVVGRSMRSFPLTVAVES